MSDEFMPDDERTPMDDKWDEARKKWELDHGAEKTPRERARTQIQSYFALGALCLVIGVAIMVVCWPSTTVTPGETSAFSDMLSTAPTVEKEGSASGFIAGAVLGAIGQIMLTVATIAAGVRIGSVQDH